MFKQSILILSAIFLINSYALSQDIKAIEEPFAVYELFSSEGCSSCPSADDLLEQVLEYEWPYDNVLAIAQHVTYWNDLMSPYNWVDRFSKKEFDQLQVKYCQKQGSQVYTPMILVNGVIMPLNGQTIGNEINVSISKENNAGVKVDAKYDESTKKIMVDYDAVGELDGMNLVVFLLESNLVSEVTAGENKGKTLTHENIVRIRHTQLLNEYNGSIELDMPDEAAIENCSVAAYIQDPVSMKVLSATKGVSLGTLSCAENNKVYSEIIVFPNPTTDYMQIRLSDNFSKLIRVSICDLTGNEISGSVINNTNWIQLDLSNYSSGMYFVKILSDNGEFFIKRIIKI